MVGEGGAEKGTGQRWECNLNIRSFVLQATFTLLLALLFSGFRLQQMLPEKISI